MALIPQNVERLNKVQKEMKVVYSSKMINEPTKPVYFYKKNFLQAFTFDDFNLNKQFKFISHCLRNIPEFQEPNPKFVKFNKYGNHPFGTEADMLTLADECGLIQLPQTIAAATLHGQGEYPPSTLEELCESYKKVMGK
jgi:hypothetical protein